MKANKPGKSKQSVRSQKGQSLVGGTVMMVMMSTLVVGMVLLLLNMATLANDNQQLQGIACEAARQVAAQKWWLGMERTEWKDNQIAAEAQAKEAIDAEFSAMGLPATSKVNFAYRKPRTGGGVLTVVEVSFDVSGIKVSSGGLFPSVVWLHITGVSSDSEHATAKHAMALILIEDPSDPRIQRGIRVPIYNATVGHNEAAAPAFKVGTSVGNFPNAYLNVQCRNDGNVTVNGTKQNYVFRP